MSAEEFLEGAMKLPADARWRLGMRLLESLEVNAAGSGQAVDEPRDGQPE